MKKVTGLLFLLLSAILAIGTLLNFRFVLILLLHATDLDLHAWWVAFGRLCVVFLLGFLTVKTFSAGKKRIFRAQENLYASLSSDTTSENSTTQQIAIDNNFVTRSTLLLTSYRVVFAVATIFPIIATVFIPAFHELLRSLGAYIPLLTHTVINYKIFLFIFPLIALIPTVLISRKRTIKKNTYSYYKIGLAVFASLLCIIFCTVVVALYLPIYYFGQGQ